MSVARPPLQRTQSEDITRLHIETLYKKGGEQAFQSLQKMENQHDLLSSAEIMYTLGLLLEEGRYHSDPTQSPKDPIRALTYFNKAATSGHQLAFGKLITMAESKQRLAAFYVGCIYDLGANSIKANHDLAIDYYAMELENHDVRSDNSNVLNHLQNWAAAMGHKKAIQALANYNEKRAAIVVNKYQNSPSNAAIMSNRNSPVNSKKANTRTASKITDDLDKNTLRR